MNEINPDFYPKKKKKFTKSDYIDGVYRQDTTLIAELITLLESTDEAKKSFGLEVLSSIDTHTTTVSKRIGITGSPGVGKSTFINAYATFLSDLGHTVAVLAVDPSSQPTKGSILGDKTRMHDLLEKKNVFVRPSPAGEMLGGVAKGTKEAILICEKAGYEFILLETVGVGQSEHLASQMVDITVLLLQIGAGDEIQGIKRGIMEMGDIFVINKDDGNNQDLVKMTMHHYKQALSYLPSKVNLQYNKVLTCSALHSRGIDIVHQSIMKIHNFYVKEKNLYEIRKNQDRIWFELSAKEYMMKTLLQNEKILKALNSRSNHSIIDQIKTFRKSLDEVLANIN